MSSSLFLDFISPIKSSENEGYYEGTESNEIEDEPCFSRFGKLLIFVIIRYCFDSWLFFTDSVNNFDRCLNLFTTPHMF